MRNILATQSNKVTGEAGVITLKLNKGVYFCGKILSTEITAGMISVDKSFVYCSDEFGQNEISIPTTSSYVKILEDNTSLYLKIGTGRYLYYEFTDINFLTPIVYDDLILNDSSLLKYSNLLRLGISDKIFDSNLDLTDFKGAFKIGYSVPIKGDIDKLPTAVKADLQVFTKMTGGDLSGVLKLYIFTGTCTYTQSIDRSANSISSLNLKVTNAGGLDLLLMDLARVTTWGNNVLLYLWGERTSASDSAVATIVSKKPANGAFEINGVAQ